MLKNRRRVFLSTLVLAEIIIIIGLGYQLYIERQRVSNFAIYAKNYIHPSDSLLRYYYEPKPSTVDKQILDYRNINGPQVPTHIFNADGFDQIKTYPTQKKKGIFRIITLGNSMTSGANVNSEDTYPAQLEKVLNTKLQCKNISSFQVINLGVDGYDLQYSAERYRLRGEKYDPDLVLWLILDDDFERINEQFRPLLVQAKANMTEEELKQYHAQGVAYPEMIIAENQLIKQEGGKKALYAKEKTYLDRLGTYYKNKLVLFTFPFTEAKIQTILQNFALSRSHTFFYNRLPNIYNIADEYLPDRHPSPKGYSVMVDNLANYMVTNNIIPCQK